MQVLPKNYGVELLRIIAMIMIVTLHTLGQGGILESAKPNTIHYHFTWLLEITCFCAVNIYALISGFVLHDKQFRLSRLINLWFSVSFYTIIISLLMTVSEKVSCNRNVILDALFPISRSQYWYLSAYFGVLLLAPFLNLAIKSIAKDDVKKIILPSIILVSIHPTLFSSDPLSTHVGYSCIWLCILYLVGGLIRRFSLHTFFSKKILFGLFASMICATYISKIVLIYMTKKYFHIENECNVLITYISPTIIMSSIALFCFCVKLKFTQLQIKLIACFAPMTLGVYIIHANPLIWNLYIKDFALGFQQYSVPLFGLYILLSVLSIYIACSGIDFVRIKLFQLIKISALSARIENLANRLFKLE